MKKLFTALKTILRVGASAENTRKAHAANCMRDLREKAFALTPAELGLNRQNYPQEVWGIIMETGYQGITVSLVSLADGSTSMYFSNGGGIIGAGEKDSVKSASFDFLESANKHAAAAAASTEHPFPANGQTIFHFLTYNGTASYSGLETDLGEGRDQLSPLFHAGHEVISRIRENSPS